MGIYDKLGEYLSGQNSDHVMLGFNELEAILGFDLPRSSRVHRPWWANDRSHVQAADGWCDHGWVVKSVDIENEIVKFQRIGHKDACNERGQSGQANSALEFEEAARQKMSEHYHIKLRPGKVPNVPKLFDMVSDDNTIVGDAKYYTLVKGQFLPPAKFSTIAEHVWLLENLEAREKFLVFGNDRRVPEMWLRKYGSMVKTVVFYFMDMRTQNLEKLN